MLFDLTMTAIWMVPVTVIPQHYKSFSRDTEASLSRDQARVESPLCHLSVYEGVTAQMHSPQFSAGFN